MMISVDKTKCRKCGICIKIMDGYCISETNGYPVFDDTICNTCQKCLTVCPFQAIMVNGVPAEKIENSYTANPDYMYNLLQRRRSTKHFLDRPIPKDLIEKVISVGKFAPNQNKNITVHVIDDKELIDAIDKAALTFLKKINALLFRFRFIENCVRLFYKDIGTIKKKMQHNDFKRALYENIQVIIVVSGNKHVAVTGSSGHYMLASMMYMAEALGIGTCLMDTVSLALKTSRKMRQKLNIEENVLGALVLGYSSERIVNIPHGYEVSTYYNSEKRE